MTEKSIGKTDDELLSAYIDGELPHGEADALRARLAQEPGLLQRLEAMRDADDTLREVYGAIDRAPLPEAVLKHFDEPAPVAQADNVAAFPERGLRRFLHAPVAIAASVALVAGFLVAGFLRDEPTAPGANASLVAGVVGPGSGLHELLERGASGTPLDLGDGTTAEVVLTFEDTRGDFCRQVAVEFPTRNAHGVACRRDGAWQLETIALGASTAGGPYTPAATATPEPLRVAVDGLIGAGEPLDPRQENVIISDGWKKSGD